MFDSGRFKDRLSHTGSPHDDMKAIISLCKIIKVTEVLRLTLIRKEPFLSTI